MVANRPNPRRAFRRCSRIAYNRTFDGFRRAQETAVVITNVRHSAKVRLYDSEDRVCGYALTNAAGRGVSVCLAYDGSYLTNTTYALPSGVSFGAKLSREAGRRNLVTRRDYRYGANSVYWYECGFDLLGRPTNAVDSAMLVRAYGYNNRNELTFATSGTNAFAYVYDSIGNRTSSLVNSETNSYTANNLNQYTSIRQDSGTLCANKIPQYDADGNLTEDGKYSYTYDAENRLVSVATVASVNDDLSVLNTYDHRHRRILKHVRRYNNGEWMLARVHSFVYDGNNIVLERIMLANGETHTIENFWGNDFSGSEDGAGGVGGLLAVSVDGTYCFPRYANNGNITRYIGEDGSVVAQFVYDSYGNIIEQSGTFAELLAIRFSTKYTDSEVGLVSYLRRFYDSFNGRWINRDPIGESGGENLYAFCENNAISKYDALGHNVTLTTGNRNASWWQVGNRFYHQEICVDTWSWNQKSCCWRKSGRSCYSFAATGFGFGESGSDWLGMDSIKGPGILRGEVYPTGDQGLEDTETLETTPCQDRAFLDYLKSMDVREDTYSLGRHSCRTFSQAMMEEAKRRKNRGGCKNDKKCE